MFPSSPLDQPIRQIYKDEEDIFNEVDEVISKATVVGDPEVAFSYGLSLIRSGLLRAHALAKLLYKMRTVWELFGIQDPFEDVIFERMGIAKATTDKYVRMWEAIFENAAIDEKTKQLLMGRPIRDLLMLTAAAREGSLNNEQLSDAAQTPDRASLREMIREARGDATSSGTAVIIKLVWREDAKYPKGSLVAIFDHTAIPFGTLDVDSTDDAVKRAIERIINAAGILED